VSQFFPRRTVGVLLQASEQKQKRKIGRLPNNNQRDYVTNGRRLSLTRSAIGSVADYKRLANIAQLLACRVRSPLAALWMSSSKKPSSGDWPLTENRYGSFGSAALSDDWPLSGIGISPAAFLL
jgi:hypothetical protein